MSFTVNHRHLLKEDEGGICLFRMRRPWRWLYAKGDARGWLKIHWCPPGSKEWICIPFSKNDEFMEAVGKDAKMEVLNG